MEEKNERLGIGIRKMLLEDLDEVYIIETTCFPSVWSRQAFEESIKHLESLVIYYLSSKEIIGFFIGYGATDEYSIYNIAVKPNYQGRGFGTYLLNAVMRSHSQKYESYFLEVRKSNTRALSIYYKLGFKLSYTRQKYYTNPEEDALVLKFTLKKRS